MGVKRKHYAVRRGHKTGIFSTWDECKAQVNGFRDCQYKAFKNLSDAEAFVGDGIKNDVNSAERPSISIAISINSNCYKENCLPRLVVSSSCSKKSASYYAVCRGRKTGIFSTWEECKVQTDGFSNPLYKRFSNLSDAEIFIKEKSNNSVANPEKAPLLMASETAFPFNPIGKRENPSSILQPKGTASTSSIAQKMMLKMGYVKGEGLGKNGQGIESHLKAVGIPSIAGYAPGLGCGTEKLNNLQKTAVELAKSGKNVFITGAGGTGKSVVLRRIMEHLKEKYKDNQNQYVAVAPTGTTALSIGGQTIHSFSGCGIPETSDDFQKIWKNRKKWRNLRVMIIEEISMISGEFFDRLSDIVSKIRDHHASPFGGIQLILCGDFLQLPPIPTPIHKVRAIKEALSEQSKTEVELHLNRGFTFQAQAWRKADLSVIQLDQVFRQINSDFISVLHEIRKGQVSNKTISFLRQCDRPLPSNKHGIKPTILYAKNKDVTNENMMHLSKLPGKLKCFTAKDRIEVDDNAAPRSEKYLSNNAFFKSCIAEKTLSLKVGAQVMLIKNERQDERKHSKKKLVNGSRGRVVGFTSMSEIDEKELACFLDNGWEGITNSSTKKKERLDNESDELIDLFPVVLFQNDIRKVIKPENFESRLVSIGTCIREAIPLKLAWAVTVHKSQGMTLDCVKVDLNGVFTDAQAYVALSRASDKKGLELRNFSKSLVYADKRAVAFYDNPNDKTFPHWSEHWGEGHNPEKQE